MPVSEKIGLLPGFGWVVDQHWFGDSWWSHLLSTLLVCWLLTPVGHIVFAYITQKIVIPIDKRRQWQSFFPGDLYLGGAVALLVLASDSGSERDGAWWQSTGWHGFVIVCTMSVAIAMTLVVDRPMMPLSALLSPSKLYHNFLLYGGYGYVVVTTLIAALAGGGGLWLIAGALVLSSPWAYYVLKDSSADEEATRLKQSTAHPATYWLFWCIPVRGSYTK
ncbi:hypothetical protein I8H84_02475 [Candidatus Saccharibacteria bacterium]|nr:hypothetical protein [Candidatus Saccharibacteria bacterium]MBH1972811.1 hypothetical protein [Candidatus Saccharibacteria bacterium]MBH1991012.1 hypothetical protein [Candidatus Saccharibacteria bacterium]